MGAPELPLALQFPKNSTFSNLFICSTIHCVSRTCMCAVDVGSWVAIAVARRLRAATNVKLHDAIQEDTVDAGGNQRRQCTERVIYRSSEAIWVKQIVRKDLALQACDAIRQVGRA